MVYLSLFLQHRYNLSFLFPQCVCVWVGGWVGGWVRACVRACVCVRVRVCEEAGVFNPAKSPPSPSRSIRVHNQQVDVQYARP